MLVAKQRRTALAGRVNSNSNAASGGSVRETGEREYNNK